jgi:ABC-type Fe3+/spermidine/putrescine transport system ATPase subunit
MSHPVLEFRDVTKRFNSVAAVDGVTFSILPGEIFTLLGPSGCGKTTTLRLVAGLEEPDAGEIFINGIPVAAPQRAIILPPEKRHLGMVFQSYAIWPHLTVFENVAFPLRVRRESQKVIRRRVEEALEVVGLGGFAERGATQLSGGQQQRVALARALVYAPALLLLDEPLSNLDAKLREQMRLEIRALQKKLKLTVLYVTHDQSEAMTLSDRIAVVKSGCFEQIGTPAEVYERPATAFVGEFLGRTISFEGRIVQHGNDRVIAISEGAQLGLPNACAQRVEAGEWVRVDTRPEDIELLPGGELERNQVPGNIRQVAYLGDHFEYEIHAAGVLFILSAGKKQRHRPAEAVRLSIDPQRINIRRLMRDR